MTEPNASAKATAGQTHRLRWKGGAWSAMALGLLIAGTAGLASRGSVSPVAATSTGLPTQDPDGAQQAKASAPGSALFSRLPDGPESQLVAAYQALADGQVALAFERSQALARENPNFALGQMLLADLLATRAGIPSFLGKPLLDKRSGSAAAKRAPPHEGLDALRDESSRRLSALLERPAAGTLPREFIALAPGTGHAVAVDASRSRLYLFSNGPNGLTLERDFYVSLGKLGVDKRAEGDLRTPLGVYWITSALAAAQIDPRFGRAALGFNYPNALDRSEGRKGTGLFVHGVPEDTLARLPFSTDGCVALANADVLYLESRLTALHTPVVIARQLDWVPREAARQDAATFRQAYDAWDRARRQGDPLLRQAWYDKAANVEPNTADSQAARHDLSLIGWYGDAARMMVVTGKQDGAGAGQPAVTVRQYWVERDAKWRVVFEGKVPDAVHAGRRGSPGRIAAATSAQANRSQRQPA